MKHKSHRESNNKRGGGYGVIVLKNISSSYYKNMLRKCTKTNIIEQKRGNTFINKSEMP